MPVMSTPEPHPPQRVARPDPGGERGWLTLVLDHLPLPALIVDSANGQVVVRNQAASGVPPQTSPWAPVGPATTTGPDDLLHRLVADAAGEGEATITWQAPEGDVRYRIFSRLLPPADGREPLALLTFVDVSGQEAAERELREAIAARDEFFSVATHELKDPLFSVQLSLQLLRHAAEKLGEVPAHVASHLDVAGRQADRLSRIIDNLLDVARIRGNRLLLDAETIDLAELAREVTSRFQETARSAGTTLTAETAGPVIGYFDRLKLDQVLSNLLTNALKYGAGKPVTVRARAAEDSAVLEVEDNGPGVATADQGRIFAQFERASGGHKKESLGLGLYIVRSIAEAHGGAAAVRSEVGRGATFTVTLPRNRIHHKEIADGDGDQSAGVTG
jgi:signal transduction histidine kinase